MKIFVDSANLREIEEALQRGFTSGITTNPSILSKEERRDFTAHIRDIIALLREYQAPVPLSVELFTDDPKQMLAQAERFLGDFGDYENLYIKVPIGWEELRVIHGLRRMGARVNCTCCMSYNQALIAAQAGANYVSLFWGRIRDTGYDAASIVRQVRQTFKEWSCPSEIIVGSIRQMIDVNEAFLAGADIVTVPPKFLPLMCAHPKTDEAVQQFIRDFREWAPTSVDSSTEAIASTTVAR
jgi:transaldolase